MTTPTQADSLAALQIIEDNTEHKPLLVEAIETIRTALTRQPVDVDSLKKDPRINEGNGNVGEDHWPHGLNDCMGYLAALAANGYLK